MCGFRRMDRTDQPVKVLIEATKLMNGPRDGCYRYTSELLHGILKRFEPESEPWHFSCYIQGKVYELSSLSWMILSRRLLGESRIRLFWWALVVSAARTRQKLVKWFRRLAPAGTVEFLRSLDRQAGLTAELESAHQGKPIDASDFDVVHLTLPQAYRCIKPSSRTKFVVTIHDCTHRLFPEFHLDETVRAVEKGIQFALSRNAHFITDSETTRKEFLSEYEADPDRVTVIPLAVDRNRFSRVENSNTLSQIRSKYRIPERPYFLALSTPEPRKNLVNTAKAFVCFRREHPETETLFVIAGRKGWKFEELLTDQSIRDDRIVFTGFVEDGDLPALYSSAIALLFISHYEGFGLPALEGMSCGLPVIFGARGALPEVVGEAGLPADPNDLLDIKDKLAQLALNSDLREELSLKALARVDQFSWAETVARTLEIYRRVSGPVSQKRLRSGY